MSNAFISLQDPDEIASFYRSATGMSPEYTQLSTKQNALSLRIDELEGVTLIWACARGRARWRDQVSADGFQFGWMLESAGPAKVRGREIAGNEAVVWLPGQEVDYLLEGPYLSLEIGVDRSVSAERGWSLRGDPLGAVAPANLQALQTACVTASQLCRLQATTPATSSQALSEQQEQVLRLLDKVLEGWGAASGATADRPARALFRRAERHLKALAGEPLEIDVLARELGVSRRTLHRAFCGELGIGPRRYYELIRLNLLRGRLRGACSADTTITGLATELGFHDLGRLAGLYHRQFGEYPRQTLTRN